MTKPEVFAVGLGLGACVFPVAHHFALTLLGRNVFDPDYRRKRPCPPSA